jgi:hypothetical protein
MPSTLLSFTLSHYLQSIKSMNLSVLSPPMQILPLFTQHFKRAITATCRSAKTTTHCILLDQPTLPQPSTGHKLNISFVHLRNLSLQHSFHSKNMQTGIAYLHKQSRSTHNQSRPPPKKKRMSTKPAIQKAFRV